ncbi:adenosine deaminase [Legionella beliardensis]|uniref:adenosine deaminase n=1 Tax=Legionella beliardensis TaxID=91822 RepID=A0A378HZ77_9GAMM|nr:adenosine deaminase [Legionella beliardensis]STX28053.1 adenosine deaminase [Legionella beliardensis]
MRFIALFLFLIIHVQCFATVDKVFESVKANPKRLYSFLKAMPKGGELHYHLAGGAYPEAMLAIAAKNNYCLELQTLTAAYKPTCTNGNIILSQVTPQGSLYQQIIKAWSFRDFKLKKETGHDHFFNSFYKFILIVLDHPAPLLAEVMQRAASQHELYMEIMLAVRDTRQTVINNQPIVPSHFNSLRHQLLADDVFKADMQSITKDVMKLLPEAKRYLGCNTNPLQEVCQLKINFELHVLREQPLTNVFAQALLYFNIAAKVPNVVAVNLVQAEDGPISLRDYHQQMQIFNYMHQIYPNVHIALHAGELSTTANVPTLHKEDLRFHIQEAINLGHAERIGHGIDIPYENNNHTILKKMATQRIPVEINLTSNKKILKVAKNKHPFNLYLKHQVPIVLSTDDEGILRTNLTKEYATAVTDYHLNYQTLKRINHNALTYSFLPGQSLWADPMTLKPVPACKELTSKTCLNFIKSSEKATLQRNLALKLQAFENSYKGKQG